MSAQENAPLRCEAVVYRCDVYLLSTSEGYSGECVVQDALSTAYWGDTGAIEKAKDTSISLPGRQSFLSRPVSSNSQGASKNVVSPQYLKRRERPSYLRPKKAFSNFWFASKDFLNFTGLSFEDSPDRHYARIVLNFHPQCLLV